MPFAIAISRQLAASAPQLTLELLKEWVIGFSKADITQKTACLHFVRPWLVNLESFAQPSRDDAAESVKQVSDIVKSLIAITTAERQVCDSPPVALLGRVADAAFAATTPLVARQRVVCICWRSRAPRRHAVWGAASHRYRLRLGE